MFRKYIIMYKKINTLCYNGLVKNQLVKNPLIKNALIKTNVRKYSTNYPIDVNINYNSISHHYLADIPVSFNTLEQTFTQFDVNTHYDNYNYNKEILKIINKNNNNNSFIIFHPSNIVNKINQWSLLLPGITPYYALKCNPDKRIINIMKNYNIHYDCASKNEIKKILGCNIMNDKILFANPCKMTDHIQYAKSKNINLMTFDTINELYKIKEHYSSADLLLRIKVDDTKSVLKFSSKFGADISDVSKLLFVGKKLGLNIVGVSFHVGSKCIDINAYGDALHLSRQVFNLGLKAGYKFKIVDIGGGFPGADDYTFRKMTSIINTSINKYFSKDDIQFIAEPGRYFVESAYTIVAKIINKKTITENNKPKNIYFINEGIYGCFNNVLTDKATIKINTFKPNNQNIKSTIFGPSCDALDCIASNIELPNLEIDDYIYVENMGAYTTACATNFNGFNMASVKYVL